MLRTSAAGPAAEMLARMVRRLRAFLRASNLLAHLPADLARPHTGSPLHTLTHSLGEPQTVSTTRRRTLHGALLPRDAVKRLHVDAGCHHGGIGAVDLLPLVAKDGVDGGLAGGVGLAACRRGPERRGRGRRAISGGELSEPSAAFAAWEGLCGGAVRQPGLRHLQR